MSDINFCNTKEQLNHLGEVVTGKVDGSPTGADIDTSTLPYTGQVRKTLPALEGEYEQSITDKEAEADAAIDAYRLLSKGPYAAGILLEDKFQYITYNGESYFAVNPPYTTTATTPDTDGNLFAGGYLTSQQLSLYTDIVYRASGGNSAVENMVAGAPTTVNVGEYCACENGTIFKRIGNATGSISDYKALNDISITDFGASVDIQDNEVPIQLAIDYAFDHETSKRVYVPDGDFQVSSPIYLYGGAAYRFAGVALVGNNSRSSKLRATSDFGVDTGVVYITNRTNTLNQTPYNAGVKSLNIEATPDNTAIYVRNGISYGNFDDLHLTGKEGLRIRLDSWVNNFTNMIINPTENGFIMQDEGTTNHFDRIFVVGSNLPSEGIAYRLAGWYSTIGALACDTWAGSAYEFSRFYGHVGALGFEKLDQATSHLTFENSDATIGHVYAINGYNVPSGRGLIENTSSRVVISTMSLFGGVDQLGSISKSNLDGETELGHVRLDFEFAEVPAGNATFKPSQGGTEIASEYGWGRPYIGSSYFGAEAPDFVGADRQVKAIYLDSYGNIHTGGASGGVDYRFSRQPNNGDLFLENEPSIHGCAGHVVTETNSDLLNAGQAPLLIGIGGLTANRPSSPSNYVTYFDTSIGKPIWWNGAQWVDALGVAV